MGKQVPDRRSKKYTKKLQGNLNSDFDRNMLQIVKISILGVGLASEYFLPQGGPDF